jgi:hypothetical protein
VEIVTVGDDRGCLNDNHWQIGGLLIGGGTEHPKVVRSTQQGGVDPGT